MQLKPSSKISINFSGWQLKMIDFRFLVRCQFRIKNATLAIMPWPTIWKCILH